MEMGSVRSAPRPGALDPLIPQLVGDLHFNVVVASTKPDTDHHHPLHIIA